MKLLTVAVAGAVGAMCRYALITWVHKEQPAGFPWGTLLTNLSGCLIMGFILGVFDGRVALTATLRTVIFAGFLGSFTTYSAFALETQSLLHTQPHLAFLNIFLHVGVGLLFVYGGMILGRAL